MQRRIRNIQPTKEHCMATLLKWMVSIIVAALAWLVTGYTLEYFRPYQRSHDRSRRGMD